MNDNENLEYQVPHEFLEKELHLVSVLFCWKRITIPLRSFRVVKSIHCLIVIGDLCKNLPEHQIMFDFASEF